MTDQIFINNDRQCPWEYEIGEEGRDDVIRWRTLLSSDSTPSQGISMGTLEISPGASLTTHYHSPLEVYYLTEGEGQLLCGDKIKNIRAGDVVYVPGQLVQSALYLKAAHRVKTAAFNSSTYSEASTSGRSPYQPIVTMPRIRTNMGSKARSRSESARFSQ